MDKGRKYQDTINDPTLTLLLGNQAIQNSMSVSTIVAESMITNERATQSGEWPPDMSSSKGPAYRAGLMGEGDIHREVSLSGRDKSTAAWEGCIENGVCEIWKNL